MDFIKIVRSLQKRIEILERNLGAMSIFAGDSPSIDAFGRWRVSNTGQRFDAEFTLDKQPSLFDEVFAGSGSSTYNTSTRDIDLFINDTSASSSASLIQHWHNPYTPGNSQLIDVTGTLDGASIGGGTASIFLRNNGIDEVFDQAEWNKNTVEDVDWSKSQILQMDFQSLKVGRVRFNLVRDGLPVNVHEITNDNIRSNGYWQYPNQPVQWKIYNDGLGNTVSEAGYFNGSNGIGFRYTIPENASAKIIAICATVKSEGGQDLFNMPGFTRSADMGTTDKTVSTTLVPLISIRPRSTFNLLEHKGLIIPESYNVQVDNPIRLVVLLNPTLTGASWSNVDTINSAVEYDTSATTVSGGITVNSEYIGAGSKNTVAKDEGLLGRTLLAYGSNSISDIITLAAVRTTSTSADTLGAIAWREIR